MTWSIHNDWKKNICDSFLDNVRALPIFTAFLGFSGNGAFPSPALKGDAAPWRAEGQTDLSSGPSLTQFQLVQRGRQAHLQDEHTQVHTPRGCAGQTDSKQGCRGHTDSRLGCRGCTDSRQGCRVHTDTDQAAVRDRTMSSSFSALAYSLYNCPLRLSMPP